MNQTRRSALWGLAAALVLSVLVGVGAGGGVEAQEAAASPLLVILTETGQTKEGLPVLAAHPDADEARDKLLRGFSGRVMRIYRMARTYLEAREGVPVEPAASLASGSM